MGDKAGIQERLRRIRVEIEAFFCAYDVVPWHLLEKEKLLTQELKSNQQRDIEEFFQV